MNNNKTFKTVDVYVKAPCFGYATIKSDCYGVQLCLSDIRLNIAKGNQVYEILPNGKKIYLTHSNYDKDNNVYIKADGISSKPATAELRNESIADTLKSTMVEKEPIVDEEVKEEEVEEDAPVVEKKKSSKKKSGK